MRLLSVLSLALVALLLVSGLAGPARAHGGALAAHAALAGPAVPDAAPGAEHRHAAHCHGGAACLPAIEAAETAPLPHDGLSRPLTAAFEPRRGHLRALAAEPPPPRG
ncbi:hypothetical protein [Actibacterium sp. MT2.3-13A]|uniref:hypothetical protein n=1 Tax=Actibacterium sp. MT2.3-13A TaxID=2828332 RepID=UPI001BAB7846|nr:hypothetical protein [Actibacterium sp. MT2.3-13A]